MVFATERLQEKRQGTYYLLGSSIETSLSKDVVNSNPHFRKLVNICLNTLESSPVQLYENGHESHHIAGSNNHHFFSVDLQTGKRKAEISGDQISLIPDHILSKDGQMIMVKAVSVKGVMEYWQLDQNGRLLLTEKPTINNGKTNEKKPEKTGVKADSAVVIKKKYVDKKTGENVIALTDREILREEIGEIAAFHFADLLESSETESTVGKWLDVIEVVPDLIKLLSHTGSYIEAVQKSHTLNIASAAMQIAKNPDTKVKIVSGFGASNTERSNCYVANALPALEMADRMRSYFEQRKTKGKNGLNNTPAVELVFAQEGGIQVNYQDEAESVRAKTADNITHVQNFAHELYPQVPLSVTSDIAWSDLSPRTEQVIRYYASILRHHPSRDIEGTLGNLVKFGLGKGSNGSSRDTAAEYAAIHPFVWGLKPSFAEVQYLKDETPADIVIRIGPRAEIKFDAMIMTIKRWENPVEFAQFSREPITCAPAEKPKEPTTILLISGVGRQGPTYFKYAYDCPAETPPEETKRRLKTEIDSLTNLMIDCRKESIPLSELAEKRGCLRARLSDLEMLLTLRGARLTGITAD